MGQGRFPGVDDHEERLGREESEAREDARILGGEERRAQGLAGAQPFDDLLEDVVLAAVPLGFLVQPRQPLLRDLVVPENQ